MKFGFRVPSLKKRIAARTSPSRILRHSIGIKAPKGYGVVTDPKKYVYNKIYNKTSFGCVYFLLISIVPFALFLTIFSLSV